MNHKTDRIKHISSIILFGAALMSVPPIVTAHVLNQTQTEINTKLEKNILHHFKEDNSITTTNDIAVSYLITDSYLEAEKGLQVTTLNDGFDYKVENGLTENTVEYYNNLVKQVKKYDDNSKTFANVDYDSSAYAKILTERNELVSAFYNSNVENNESFVDFKNYLTNNFKTEQINGWTDASKLSFSLSFLASLMIGIVLAGVTYAFDRENWS